MNKRTHLSDNTDAADAGEDADGFDVAHARAAEIDV
jgi:hypothetical protein